MAGKVAAAMLAAACVLSLFLPPPRVLGGAAPAVCRWEDGAVTEETCGSVLSCLTGADETGLLLERGGKAGRIGTGEEFRAYRNLLEEGDLADLLSRPLGDVSPFERAALYRLYGTRGYYAGELFCFDGERVFRTDRTSFDEIMLLFGDLAPDLLADTGATSLVISGGAELSPRGLSGSRLVTVEARAPYFYEDGAIYRRVAGTVRLVAGLPFLTSLTAKFDYLDEDALLPCTALEEADLCGIPQDRFPHDAFAHCASLCVLHTTAENPVLAGTFQRTVAPCGCYIYRRENP